MSNFKTWFAQRSKREQRLILVMLALAAVTLVWAGIIRPVDDGLASARERHAAAVDRLGETEVAVAALKAAGQRRALTGTLADTVRTRADAAGFAIATLDDQGGDRVHLTIQSARPGALDDWLATLERSGILVDAATLRDNGDRTVAADLVLKARVA